jgi:alpha-mannosidase
MLRRILPLLVIILLSFVTWDANAQLKKIYIANDDHTDYMWTLNEAGYKTAFLTMLDSWIAKNTSSYGNGPNSPTALDTMSKWNTDGSFWIWTYEKNRSAVQFDTLIAQVRRGQITVPYSPLIVTYGSIPAEAVLRGMYYAGDLERRKNLRFKMATSMENQTTPLGVASLWKGAGAKYCWQGVCSCFTQVPALSSRAKEIYWAKGLDTNKVLMKWYSYLPPPIGTSTGSYIGGYSEARYVNNTITDLLNKCGTGAYPFNIAGGFGVGYDDPQTLANNTLRDAAVANTNINQRIVVSNETDFFEDFETTHGSTLDSLSVTYGNEWDIAVASLAEVSAKVKRSLEKLRAAEAMAAVVINYEPTFTAPLDSMRKEAWMSMGLYYEHNFGFEQGTNTFVQRNAFQRRQQKSITDYVDSLYNLSKAKLGYYITQGLGANTRFFAFNPLGWKRTDYADYKYSLSMTNKRVIEVLSGNEVPYQTVTKDGNQYLRILADSIPSVGYKIYEIQNTAPASFPNTDPAATATTIDNGVYQLTCTKEGVITSLIDLANSKQLVTGGTKFINDLGTGLITDPLSSSTVESNGPISVTIRCDANLPIKHTTRITLYKNVPRVDIDNQITQALGATRTWAYSFNIASPTVWHEETGAVIKAKLKANGGHYSAQNARYDWSTLHHFASVNDAAGYGVSLSNQDCYFMKLGNSSVGTLNQNTADLNILAGGQIDGGTGNPLGIPSQGGDVLFNQRFAITTHNNYSAANDMKKALEHQDSMVCGTVSTLVNFLPESQYSYMSNSDPSSLIWSIKPSEEGWLGGAITRIWNLSDNDASPTVNFDLVIDAAARTSHVETDMEELSIAPGTRNLTVGLGHNEMKTFRTKLIIIPLVARVLSFTGNKITTGNELRWNTSGETELKEYILERNAGNGFIAIATIKAERGNGENRYVYNDKNINDQTTYQYRLKLIATNGKFNYSSVVLIRSGNETGSMLVFPNPVSSPVNIHLVLDKKTRCDVTVYNAAGAVVKKPSPPLFEKGNNYYTIPIDELAPGHYTIVVNAGDKKFTESFVKW